jgi:hypothetical protein
VGWKGCGGYKGHPAPHPQVPNRHYFANFANIILLEVGKVGMFISTKFISTFSKLLYMESLLVLNLYY